ncbi:MAG: hypothetical protein ACKO0Z_25910 [Betaproteobacteria bacterium]
MARYQVIRPVLTADGIITDGEIELNATDAAALIGCGAVAALEEKPEIVAAESSEEGQADKDTSVNGIKPRRK